MNHCLTAGLKCNARILYNCNNYFCSKSFFPKGQIVFNLPLHNPLGQGTLSGGLKITKIYENHRQIVIIIYK